MARHEMLSSHEAALAGVYATVGKGKSILGKTEISVYKVPILPSHCKSFHPKRM